jgi:hypothetical protein
MLLLRFVTADQFLFNFHFIKVIYFYTFKVMYKLQIYKCVGVTHTPEFTVQS